MYDIRQFRPALYALVLLGIAGFCLAAEAGGLLVVSLGLVTLNAWLVRTRKFRPIPRLLANALTLAAGAYTAAEIYGGELPVEPVGWFLAVLQLVKLYEQRGNRDYGQLIVLSLLTMIAAAMTPGGTSLLFGLGLIAWVFLSLYACLLFHLKVETDAARRYLALGPEPERLDADAEAHDLAERRLRQDQHRLGSSVRRLTAVVAIAGIASAVVVFLGFPRGGGRGFLQQAAQYQAVEQSVVGFSGSVDFQSIARIQQNESIVAHVAVRGEGRDDDTPSPGLGELYLRGNALDVYHADPDSAERWSWSRSFHLRRGSTGISARQGQITSLGRVLPASTPLVEQSIELRPTGSTALFALAGATAIQFDGNTPDLELIVGVDGTLALTGRAPARSLEYAVLSTGRTPVVGEPSPARDLQPTSGLPGDAFDPAAEFAWPTEDLAAVRDRVETLRLATLARVTSDQADAPNPLRGLNDDGRIAWRDARVGTARLNVSWGWGSDDDGSVAGGRERDDRWQRWRNRDPDVSEAGGRRTRRFREGFEATLAPPADAVVDLALDPEATGVADDGQPLARRRLGRAGTTPDDALIASNLERYLRTQFDYSLDISGEAASLPRDRDPLDWFVQDVRRGHCELFAGTMAGALQGLGIPARVVVGFRTDEYNAHIGRWTVRQSHAHAWVEALTRDGWTRYDPTPGGGDGPGDTPGLLARATRGIREVGEYLQYAWQSHVVGYNRGDQERVRDSLLGSLDKQLAGRLGDRADNRNRVEAIKAAGAGIIELIKQRLGFSTGVAGVVAVVAATLLVLLPLGGLIAVAFFLLERWRLRRRARRIGLGDLPSREARRLARQLGFYDDMVRLLDRRGLRRTAGQTPREFAATLAAALPPRAFEAVGALTDVFYRVRFGRSRVTPLRKRLLERSVERLEEALIPRAL